MLLFNSMSLKQYLEKLSRQNTYLKSVESSNVSDMFQYDYESNQQDATV
jgi:hypothetical protein